MVIVRMALWKSLKITMPEATMPAEGKRYAFAIQAG